MSQSETIPVESTGTTTADGMCIDWDVPVQMDDGVVLRADVYRPTATGQYPVIMTLGPYAKGLPFQVGYAGMWKTLESKYPDVTAGSTNKYQNWETVDPEKWVPDGYVCVRVDSRGAGRSPGYLDVYSPRENLDYYHCIEWAAQQPWSNGKIGLLGISYYAVNQWLVAQLRPPHLVAMCPWEGYADFYRECNRHGGILNTFMPEWFPVQVTSVQYGVGSRGKSNPNTGVLVAGSKRSPRRGFGSQPERPALGTAPAGAGRPVVPRPVGRPEQDRRPPIVGRQLDAFAAFAVELRGLPGRVLRSEMAGGPRPGALDGVLHRLWRRFTKALLRPLFER